MNSSEKNLDMSEEKLNQLLGWVQRAQDKGDSETAHAWLAHICLGSPHRADLWRQYIELLLLKRDTQQATSALQVAKSCAEDSSQFLDLEADVLLKEGRHALALELYERLVAQWPNNLKVLIHAGLCAQQLGSPAQGRAYFLQALSLAPNTYEAAANLGIFSWRMGLYAESVHYAAHALALRPDAPDAKRILGDALLQAGDLAAAQNYLYQALNSTPLNPSAGRDLSHALLRAGQLREGWLVSEHRWAGSNNMHRPVFYQDHTEWRPQSLARHALTGVRLVVYQEQGYGDVIQFARYLHWLQRDGAILFFWLNEALVPLIDSLNALAPEGASPITFVGPESLLHAQLHVALMDLPKAYATDVAVVEPENTLTYTQVPFSDQAYLSATAAQIADWGEKLAPWAHQFKVGLVWRGRPTHDNDFNRSFDLSLFEPLLTMAGVQCFSLQKFLEGANNDLQTAGDKLVDLSAEWQDFSDTAAMIQNLELVITIDSAICHLAGSVGAPTWTLIPPNPDWRWLDRGLGWDERTVWYPNMRLWRRNFDQSKEAQIAELVQAVGQLLGTR